MGTDNRAAALRFEACSRAVKELKPIMTGLRVCALAALMAGCSGAEAASSSAMDPAEQISVGTAPGIEAPDSIGISEVEAAVAQPPTSPEVMVPAAPVSVDPPEPASEPASMDPPGPVSMEPPVAESPVSVDPPEPVSMEPPVAEPPVSVDPPEPVSMEPPVAEPPVSVDPPEPAVEPQDPAAAEPEPVDPPEPVPEDEGWIDLFDGETTKGWTPHVRVKRLEAADGELQLDSSVNVWVLTDLEMADFELEAEVKLPADARANSNRVLGFNTGIGFRMRGGAGVPDGYQVEIEPGWLTGAIFRRDERFLGINERNNAQVNGFKALTKDVNLKDWNHVRVVAEGPHIRSWINDMLISDVTGKVSRSGKFGIQHHGRPGSGSTVAFRNIRVRSCEAGCGPESAR